MEAMNYIIQGLVRQGPVMELVGVPVCEKHLVCFAGADNVVRSMDPCQVCERIAELAWEVYLVKNERTISQMVRDGIKTCYIAGPMTGLPDYNKPAFHQMKRLLTFHQIKAFSPADHGDGMPYSWYMLQDLNMLLSSDATIFLTGWEGSPGASLEHQVAVTTGKYVKYES